MKRIILAFFILVQIQVFAQSLTSSVSSLSSFGNCVINLATAAQKFTISGTGLTNQVKLTPPIGFEIATNCVNQFTSNAILLNISNGTLATTTVFVRLSPMEVGTINGAINIKSLGATELNITVSGTAINWNIPTTNGGYYSSTLGLNGAALKTALYNKISGHSVTSYSGLWNAYSTTDNFYNGKVWDIYSTNICGSTPYVFTFGTNQCGNYSNEGDCYNREHSFPQSWFNQSSPMVSDMFHIYPTDGKVNGVRNNYPYGEVSSPTYTSLQGGKLGANTFSGYLGIVFEPIDEYKGDLARTYFYMATRYENLIAGWQNNGNADDVLNGNSFPVYDQWVIDLMVKWHNQDPVSLKEINRNNAIFGYQQNRNPYVDSPQFVQRVWGGNLPTKPTIAPSNVSVELPTSLPLKFNLKWQSGNGNRRIVLVKANAPVDAIPVDSLAYTGNAVLGVGNQLGVGNYVVYNGMGSNVLISNCTSGVTYYFAIFEYNGYEKTTKYLSTPITGSFNTMQVNLVSFSVKLNDEKTSLIEWKTESERNNDRFEIERSVDSINWINRGTIKSVGNNVSPTLYSYTDSLPFMGYVKTTFYYRLKQIGSDSSFNYSGIESITIDNSVQVNLVSFSAKLNDEKSSLIEWTTDSEQNNDRFEIERSLNDSINWTNRGMVKSAGNKTTPSLYSYTDSLPLVSNVKAIFYYRLKQIGLDATYHYTKTENVTIDHTGIENLKEMSAEWLITPNPFSNQLRIYVTSRADFRK